MTTMKTAAPKWRYGEKHQDEWWVEAHEIIQGRGRHTQAVGLAFDEETARKFAASPQLLDALTAICVMPWGYCCCPPRMGDMEGKPDSAHCGECRDARAAIAKAQEG